MASEEEKADAAAASKYSDDYSVHRAAGRGDLPAMRHFLRVAPERVHEKGLKPAMLRSTPLHEAALEGQVAAAELLLSKGAAVDAKRDDGCTPLHYAAHNGQVAAAEFLLSKGAAVDAKTNRGQTPLHIAAFLGKVAAAELLLSKGAALDAKDNWGNTPLYYAREERRTEMEQLLLNPPAKKPSAGDGKTPRDLSSKGKSEKEPLPTAADKTSEADKKAQQTPVFPFSSPRRQTSKEVRDAVQTAAKDPSSAAGSGAAAAKHQREVSKEEAARELKKAMESGNAKVLKDAIDKAKLHTVSPEEVMEAMDKYIALRESADGAALSPAQEAARELKKAMESGNAKVLKEALDKAKLHKVSQEELMEAMDKYIALRDSADPAAPSKPEEATTSKAESSDTGSNTYIVVKYCPNRDLNGPYLKQPEEANGKEIFRQVTASEEGHYKIFYHQNAKIGWSIGLDPTTTQDPIAYLGPSLGKDPCFRTDAQSWNVVVKPLFSGCAPYWFKSAAMTLCRTALTESATTSKAEKSVTTSKAESSVKLEPGHKARLAMFSARFNEKNKDTEMKFRAVHKLLMENHYEILMVEAGAGKSFGDKTLKYLRRLGEENGVMLAVCTSDYGEMTDSPFCTYYELKVAKEYNVDVLPLQVEDNWKPCPPCGEGHRDHSKSALDYIHAVFLPSIVRIDCRKKAVEEIASEIAATLRQP